MSFSQSAFLSLTFPKVDAHHGRPGGRPFFPFGDPHIRSFTVLGMVSAMISRVDTFPPPSLSLRSFCTPLFSSPTSISHLSPPCSSPYPLRITITALFSLSIHYSFPLSSLCSYFLPCPSLPLVSNFSASPLLSSHPISLPPLFPSIGPHPAKGFSASMRREILQPFYVFFCRL